MAVRLIIGRAGTGKTALCVREIRAEMARDPLGPPLLWLTPEQGTFSAERLLLTADGEPDGRRGTRGTIRAQVLSFRRLALLLAREAGALGSGAQAGKPMDEVARIVLLEEMVRQERSKLSVFAAVADRPGFIKKLDATLRELRQQGHTGRSLQEMLDAEGGGRMDAVMRRKLLDLAVLLEGWSKVVEKPDAWDFEYVMHQAALQMGVSRLITGDGGARVWVDALSALSGLELRMLAALGQHARELTITLLADPDAPALRELRAATDPAESWGLFSRTERLHRRLIDAFRRQGVALAQPVALRTGHRFVEAGIRRVEAELLEERPVAREAEPRVSQQVAAPVAATVRAKKRRRVEEEPSLFDGLEQDVGSTAFRLSEPALTPGHDSLKAVLPTTVLPAALLPTGVEIWESSDPETEVRVAAQAIREMVTGAAALRYRQIALIVPDLDEAAGGGGYQDAIRRIFAEHGIPHFIDARRGMAHHPLVELLRSAVALVTSHFDRDEMLLFLKTQLAGVAAEDVALLENYAIEHGVSHMPWDQPWTWIAANQREEDADERVPASARQRLARVNAIRAQVWESLRGLVTTLQEAGTQNADRYPRALRELLTKLQVEKQLQAWMESARESGADGAGAELAQVHQQVWREVTQLLALLETVLADRPRTQGEFERLLATALQSLTLGLIPPTVDQVLVSSVTRSRVPEMEVVLILGAVEGQFPKVVSEDPILSDAQRAAFNAIAADPIGEGSDRQLLEMPFFDYVALTRARRRLIVSCPLADRQGKALGRSRHVQRLNDLLGASLVTRRFDASSRLQVDRIATSDDLLASVSAWARRLRAAENGGTGDEALMPAVYNWLVGQQEPALMAARRQVWPALGPRKVPTLSEAMAARFFPPAAPLRMSVSQLEQFAACPLQYFANYTLGLRPRAEFQLDHLSLGQLQHRILERVYLRLIKNELDWPQCTREEVRAVLTAEVDGTIQELHAEISQRTPGYDKMRHRLIRVLGIVLEADRRRANQGEMRPAAVELYFGKGNAPQTRENRLVSLPVLELPGRQRTIQISGKIDRMDAPESGEPQAVVIDYKSAARKSMDLFRVRHGISLQLPTYALVMATLAHRDPLAALYMALGQRWEVLEHEGEAAAANEDAFFQKLKPRGLVDAAQAWQLDRDLLGADGGAGGKSRWYQVRFNQDGRPTKNYDTLAHADFQFLLAFTAWMIASLGDALAAGTIAPAPYRCGQEIPCSRCDFVSLCPFDPARDLFREVVKEKRDVALVQMRQQMGMQPA